MSNGGGPLLAIFARGGCEQRRIYSGYSRVPLDKSEGAVKDKDILGSVEHRLLCQRG